MILNTLTFELRIFLRKKRIRLEQHKKGVKRKLFFIVPSQEAKSGQPLAPILGQVQINTFEFCSLFNTRTIGYEKGVPMYVELIVNWDKTWVLQLKPFPFSLMIYYFTFPSFNYFDLKFKHSKFVSLSNFYLLLLIKQACGLYFNLNTNLSILMGSLASGNIAISSHNDFEVIELFKYFILNYLFEYFLIQRNLTEYGMYNYYLQYVLELLELEFLKDSDMLLEEPQGE